MSDNYTTLDVWNGGESALERAQVDEVEPVVCGGVVWCKLVGALLVLSSLRTNYVVFHRLVEEDLVGGVMI